MFEVLATETFRSLDPVTCVHPSRPQGPCVVMFHSSHSHSMVRSTVTFYHTSRAAEGYSPDVPLFWLMFITSLLASHCHQGYCYLNQKLNIWNENWVVLVMSHITVWLFLSQADFIISIILLCQHHEAWSLSFPLTWRLYEYLRLCFRPKSLECSEEACRIP